VINSDVLAVRRMRMILSRAEQLKPRRKPTLIWNHVNRQEFDFLDFDIDTNIDIALDFEKNIRHFQHCFLLFCFVRSTFTQILRVCNVVTPYTLEGSFRLSCSSRHTTHHKIAFAQRKYSTLRQSNHRMEIYRRSCLLRTS